MTKDMDTIFSQSGAAEHLELVWMDLAPKNTPNLSDHLFKIYTNFLRKELFLEHPVVKLI